MLAPVRSVGPGRVLHIPVQAEEPDALPEFQKKLLTRFVTSSGSVARRSGIKKRGYENSEAASVRPQEGQESARAAMPAQAGERGVGCSAGTARQTA